MTSLHNHPKCWLAEKGSHKIQDPRGAKMSFRPLLTPRLAQSLCVVDV